MVNYEPKQGYRVAHAQVTEDEVRAIRRALKSGVTVKELAEIHRLSREQIRRIGRREAWAWVADEPEIPESLLETQPLTTAEKKDADEILARLLKVKSGG